MDYRYDHILIRYGELSLKGKNRKNFIHRLSDNLKKALKGFPTLEFEAQYDRMYVYLHQEDSDAVCEVIAKVFGISSFSPAMKVEPTMEAVLDSINQAIDLSTPHTFKVKARRHDKSFELNSDAINRAVATQILKNSDWKVDVHNPEVTILIEVRADAIYVMTEKIEGAGGFPVGVGGRAMVLLSGGIDSPVAAYLMMKRGIHLEAIHFAAPPYTSAEARDKVFQLARLIAPYQGDLVVHVVPFTTLQLAIYQHAPESYAITLMRRMMMRIADGLAQKRHCLAIGTGESVGQVASQTLESMNCINAVTNMPMIRPVVCMDKVEIIDIARHIGTYETSILPFEDCCTIFTPKAPVTKPKKEKCEAYEARWDWQDMVDDCINMAETIRISFKDEVKNEEEDLF
ncbi:MAG: tRNA uracil 4-sulfurtransferase ThiI [Erysipelotrichaceae bacterium]|nr:tRNA uracil 4-sulfurtransferase ThiI [Erysipelotrichaceae bacterium]